GAQARHDLVLVLAHAAEQRGELGALHLAGGFGIELRAVARDLDQVVEGVLDLPACGHANLLWGKEKRGDHSRVPAMRPACSSVVRDGGVHACMRGALPALPAWTLRDPRSTWCTWTSTWPATPSPRRTCSNLRRGCTSPSPRARVRRSTTPSNGACSRAACWWRRWPTTPSSRAWRRACWRGCVRGARGRGREALPRRRRLGRGRVRLRAGLDPGALPSRRHLPLRRAPSRCAA